MQVSNKIEQIFEKIWAICFVTKSLKRAVSILLETASCLEHEAQKNVKHKGEYSL